ncbi:MAG: hypothetical protein ACKVON_07190 [Beijerinckiaceae bacterium]
MQLQVKNTGDALHDVVTLMEGVMGQQRLADAVQNKTMNDGLLHGSERREPGTDFHGMPCCSVGSFAKAAIKKPVADGAATGFINCGTMSLSGASSTGNSESSKNNGTKKTKCCHDRQYIKLQRQTHPYPPSCFATCLTYLFQRNMPNGFNCAAQQSSLSIERIDLFL